MKDENGEFEGAIEDYNKAIALNSKNAMAYFNRGNTYFNLGNKTQACEDWNIARELGDETAPQRMEKNCK